MDNHVLSWGLGQFGELGLGRDELEVTNPRLIDSLLKYSVIKIACGNGFSVFVTKNGLVLTCGSHSSGCLGHPNKEDLFEPRLINSLINVNILEVSSGTDYVVVISIDGFAWAWGNNRNGKLGIHDTRPMVPVPARVVVPEGVRFMKVFCGADATAFLDHLGNLWLCGSNEHNKLALNRVSMFGTRPMSFVKSPHRVRLAGKSKCSQVAFAHRHTLFLHENGSLVAAGNNQEGQLGRRHIRPVLKAVYCTAIPRYHQVKVGGP